MKPFKVGETCHIFYLNHKGKTTSGKIIHKFNIKDNIYNPHYVIAVDSNNGIDIPLEVRANVPLFIFKDPIVLEFTKDEVQQSINCERLQNGKGL